MDSKSSSTNLPVGVIGAGSFGTVIANILAQRSPVLLYAKPTSTGNFESKWDLHEQVTITHDPKHLASACEVIFPIVPSGSFRKMMQEFSRYLHPYHILIHGTKGLDLSHTLDDADQDSISLARTEVFTMSEVIRQESIVVRVGCLAGPNLARELADGKPAATVIASPFQEVVSAGQRLLRSDTFQVYGSNDLIGVELCGVLKNIMAIASGMLHELALGENARGLLISRGLVEMIYLGELFGGHAKSFMGLAGVGDLVATSNSTTSRNFTVGRYLAQGKTLAEIQTMMEETAEGINTVQIAHQMVKNAKVRSPITETLFGVLFNGVSAEEALSKLMRYPSFADIDFKVGR